MKRSTTLGSVSSAGGGGAGSGRKSVGGGKGGAGELLGSSLGQGGTLRRERRFGSTFGIDADDGSGDEEEENGAVGVESQVAKEYSAEAKAHESWDCLLYTSPSPRDRG